MPELPEVETVRRGLDRWVGGRRVTTVEVLDPRSVRGQSADDFRSRILGRTLTHFSRRGKFLWAVLDAGPDAGPRDGAPAALSAHLGMTGQMLVARREAADERHLRVRLGLGAPPAGLPPERLAEARQVDELRFRDQRVFGYLRVEPLVPAADALGESVPGSVAHIARDPLDPLFDDEAFLARLRGRHSELKRALLDQTLVSGVGNIYADESLWAARLHPLRRTWTLTRPECVRLLSAARDVLGRALAAGGTSFDAMYVNVNGESGYFDRSLNAYGRAGRGCARCGTPIVRRPFMNRSAYFCPHCQPRPRPLR